MKRTAELLEDRTHDSANAALDLIDEALSTCSYSERLLEMKVEALIVVCYFLIYLYLYKFTIN